jgi:O-antigen/teichoic acid export membrane protein
MTTRAFLQSIKLVLSGTAIAQSIPLLGSLIIARLYVPMEFGVFSAWLGVVMTAAVMITGRLEMALVVEPDGEPRRFAMIATLVTIVGVCSASTIIAVCIYWSVPVIRNLTPSLVLMFLPATLLAATVQTWQSWAAAEGLYRELSSIRIAQALGVTGIQIIVGWFAPNAASLALGYVLGVFSGVCVSAYFMPINLNFLKPWPKFKVRLIAFWVNHSRFPLFALPADVINTTASQLPILIIASKFGAESSGLFALTIRVLGAPIGLLGAAVLDVFKRSAATSFRDNNHCRHDYIGTFRLLAPLGVVLAIGIMIVAEPLFVLAFGESWRYAGVIAVWLMPMFAMRFVASPLSYVFYIAGKQHIDLVWQCALLAMTLVTFLLPNDFEVSVTAYSVGYSILYLAYLILSYRFSMGKNI